LIGKSTEERKKTFIFPGAAAGGGARRNPH
jgi:hypothetical protein